MKPDYAFEFKDLAVLLTLELTEPADHADIEAITTILDRRHGAHTSQPAEQGDRHRPALRLVPDCLP
jgi:hypothetical protein